MLTGRQQEILDFIVSFRRQNGCSPSIPEIQRHFGIRSPNGVAGHLLALETKGYIRRAERGSRQIDVTSESTSPSVDFAAQSITPIPIYGQIPAGPPDPVFGAKPDEYMKIDEVALGFQPRTDSFALKVRGDSMRDAGILNGDTVVVEPSPNPRAGQIVVALIDGESTLKRLVKVRGQWFLKAENPAYPELFPRADLVIQGVVRTVIRRLN